MKVTAKKVETAGALLKSKHGHYIITPWTEANSIMGDEKEGLLHALRERFILAKPKNIRVFGIHLNYSKLQPINLNSSLKELDVKPNINTRMFVPLVTRKKVEQMFKTLSESEFLQFVYLTFASSYYLDEWMYTSPDIAKESKLLRSRYGIKKVIKSPLPKIRTAKDSVGKVGKKNHSPAKQLALQKNNGLPTAEGTPKTSNKAVLSAFKPVLKESKKEVLLREFKAHKPSKKAINGRMTVKDRKAISKAKVILQNQIDAEVRRRAAMAAQAKAFEGKDKKEVVMLPERVRVDNHKFLKGGKNKLEFNHDNSKSGKDRVNLHKVKFKNRLIKMNDGYHQRFFKTKEEAEIFLNDVCGENTDRSYKYLAADIGVNMIDGDSFLVEYKVKRNRKYKSKVVREKKSMNYVIPQSVVSGKKPKTANANALVCVKNGVDVYRVSRSIADRAVRELKDYAYTTKSEWKAARKAGTGKGVISFPTDRIKNLKKAILDNKVAKTKAEKVSKEHTPSEWLTTRRRIQELRFHFMPDLNKIHTKLIGNLAKLLVDKYSYKSNTTPQIGAVSRSMAA